MKRFWKKNIIWNWTELIINILLWILMLRLSYVLEVAKMSDKPNRVVIEVWGDISLGHIRAARPDVVVIIHPLQGGCDLIYGNGHLPIEPLGMVQEICPECRAMIPPDL
jgi:hypothetical protein